MIIQFITRDMGREIIIDYALKDTQKLWLHINVHWTLAAGHGIQLI